MHEQEAAEAGDDDVPATYNNMPLKRKHIARQASDDEDAAEDEDDVQQHQAEAKQKKNRGQQQQKPEQVMGQDLDFAASDAESDEYEPTQAKAAVKAAAKTAADRATRPKGPRGKPRQPKQGKQQGGARQPHKVAKAAVAEGPAKHPRGRPKKAQQEQQPPRQQPGKRKAAEVGSEEEESDEEPRAVAVEPKARGGGRLKRAALMPDATKSKDAPFQVRMLTAILLGA